MRKATNANTMKERNKRLVLDLIRQAKLSRAEIAAVTGLTKPAVSVIIEDLICRGIVLETPSTVTSVGRRPLILTLNKDAGYAIGVNITRLVFTVGLINLHGEILNQETHSIAPDIQSTLNAIEAAVWRQMQHAKQDKLLGIGVTTPGPVDARTGTIINPPNFSDWHNFSVVERFTELSGLPVYLENIANAWALGEKYFGVAKDVSNFLTLIVDEGVGSGIVLGGKIYQGINELGHTSIKFDGIPCACGNKGCLEQYASMPALLNGSGFTNWKQVIDQQARHLITKEAEYLSAALVNAANLFHLQMIVLAGDIRYQPQQLIPYIEQAMQDKCLTNYPVIAKGTSIDSAILCAGTLVLDHFFH